MAHMRAVATVRRILPIVTSLRTRGARARTCVYPGIGHSSMLTHATRILDVIMLEYPLKVRLMPRQSPPVPRFLPVTGPGGEDTAPRARTLKTAPARAYARDWRGKVARGLGADPPRPPTPRAAPVPASPSLFARDRPRGGRYYWHGP